MSDASIVKAPPGLSVFDTMDIILKVWAYDTHSRAQISMLTGAYRCPLGRLRNDVIVVGDTRHTAAGRVDYTDEDIQMIDGVVKNLPGQMVQYLDLHYRAGMGRAKIMEKLSISKRSYYTLRDSTIEEFARLARIGGLFDHLQISNTRGLTSGTQK